MLWEAVKTHLLCKKLFFISFQSLRLDIESTVIVARKVLVSESLKLSAF